MISLNKMNWTPTQVERFQFQREMRLIALHQLKNVKIQDVEQLEAVEEEMENEEVVIAILNGLP